MAGVPTVLVASFVRLLAERQSDLGTTLLESSPAPLRGRPAHGSSTSGPRVLTARTPAGAIPGGAASVPLARAIGAGRARLMGPPCRGPRALRRARRRGPQRPFPSGPPNSPLCAVSAPVPHSLRTALPGNNRARGQGVSGNDLRFWAENRVRYSVRHHACSHGMLRG